MLSIFKNTVSGICGQCICVGLGKIDLWEIMKHPYATQFIFYVPGPNWPHVSEWIEETSCNL
jgi:hypothetical protein